VVGLRKRGSVRGPASASLELGPAAIGRVVGVRHEPVAAFEGVHAVVSDAGPAGIARDQHGAAALVHAFVVGVDIGAGDVARAADRHLVVAVDAAAAVIPGHE
jgi:hypothetical protein